MNEHFGIVKPGDPISASRDNRMAQVCERFGQAGIGSYLSAHHGASTFSISGRAPAPLFTMEVTNTKINDSDEDNSGLYLGKIRWYSTSGSQWKSDDSREYEIDSTDVCPLLIVGDRLTCYWNGQRSMFIPIPDLIRRFELKTALEPGASAIAYLLYGKPLIGTDEYSTDTSTGDPDNPGNPEVEFVVWDVLSDLNGIAKTDDSPGSRGYAKWMSDSQRWEIISIQSYLLATMISATVNDVAGVVAGAATFPIDNVVVLTPENGILLSEPDTVRHITGLPADNDAKVIAWLDETNGVWYGIPVTKTTEC